MDDLLPYLLTSCGFPWCEWLRVSALQSVWRWFLERGCFLYPNLGSKTCPRTVGGQLCGPKKCVENKPKNRATFQPENRNISSCCCGMVCAVRSATTWNKAGCGFPPKPRGGFLRFPGIFQCMLLMHGRFSNVVSS